MVLKFIPEENQRMLKTIFYGIDGSGKSTGAKIYCESRGLHPAVIDFDYTNHTGLPRLECDWDTDLEVINGVIEIIKDVEKHPQLDTLIIDGVGTFNNLLLPKGKESKRTYLIRTQNFKKIWKVLLHANIHVIFIGQKDMIVTEDNESSKFAEMINNMVDYKFHCIHSGKGFTSNDFTYICTKTRGEREPLVGKPLQSTAEPVSTNNTDDVFRNAAEIGEPNPEDTPIRNQAFTVKDILESEGKPVTKQNMKVRAVRLVNEGILPKETKHSLLDYISKHCPEELLQ